MSSTGLVIALGAERCAIDGAPALLDAARARYAGFVLASGDPTARLRVEITPDFRGDYAAPVELALRLEADALCFDGAARGSFDLSSGEGALAQVADVGALDAALRAFAAARAPLRGGIWMHGLLAAVHGGAIVLVGSSGAGKSTTARELDAACDELVVVQADGREASSTPYWAGRPLRAPLVALGVLVRGDGDVERITGGAAVRALAPHVVRYASGASAERAAFEILGVLAARGVWRIEAPTGTAFPAFIRRVVHDLASSPVGDRLVQL